MGEKRQSWLDNDIRVGEHHDGLVLVPSPRHQVDRWRYPSRTRIGKDNYRLHASNIHTRWYISRICHDPKDLIMDMKQQVKRKCSNRSHEARGNRTPKPSNRRIPPWQKTPLIQPNRKKRKGSAGVRLGVIEQLYPPGQSSFSSRRTTSINGRTASSEAHAIQAASKSAQILKRRFRIYLRYLLDMEAPVCVVRIAHDLEKLQVAGCTIPTGHPDRTRVGAGAGPRAPS